MKEKKNRDTLTSNNTCTRTKERQTRNKTTRNTYEKERKRHKKKEGEETKNNNKIRVESLLDLWLLRLAERAGEPRLWGAE